MRSSPASLAAQPHRAFSQPLEPCLEEEGGHRVNDKKRHWRAFEKSREEGGSRKACLANKNDQSETESDTVILELAASDMECPFQVSSSIIEDGGASVSMPKLGTAAKERNYSFFRTRSGNLMNPAPSRQNSFFPLKKDAIASFESTAGNHIQRSDSMNNEEVPAAGRYFDALQGPELEILKRSDSEDVLLPLDQKWPFLLRFPINCFGICLGLGSQAILWKHLHSTPSVHFLHVPSFINFLLWGLALSCLIIISATYLSKCVFYFEAVRREYYHPVRVNFFFAPCIACMFLSISVPPRIATSIHPSLFCVLMTPILLLELKIYGQWLSGGNRRLSKVANPSLHLSVVGNFVGAVLGSMAGLKEPAIFFWAVGLAHYLVLFVTLYQRLPTNEALPRELHPVFFLFIAAPSTASVAWANISGSFDSVSKICYFVALFLFTSLIVRINFFRGFRFTLAWWAYTFPTTAAAIATVRYSQYVTNALTQGLALLLSLISTVAVSTLFATTMLHAYWGSLFPNDMAIAITKHKKKRKKEAGKEKEKSKKKGSSSSSSSSSPSLYAGKAIQKLKNGVGLKLNHMY